MVQLIDGKKLAEIEYDRLVKELITLNNGDQNCPKRPNLAIILVGDRADSKLYVDLKSKQAKRIGIDTHLYRCPAHIEEREIFEMIDYLNKDEEIDAILIQLPLPAGFDTDGLIRAIDPNKDVDRFHPDNLAEFLRSCDHTRVTPPLIRTVLVMLDSIAFDGREKRAAVIANSKIFGHTMAKALECRGVSCRILDARNQLLDFACNQADLLISAVGKKGFIKENYIKEGAVVIDIGIVKEGKRVFGDVDYESVKDKAAFLTPVPGGVGPLTIAMLFANTLELYKARRTS